MAQAEEPTLTQMRSAALSHVVHYLSEKGISPEAVTAYEALVIIVDTSYSRPLHWSTIWFQRATGNRNQMAHFKREWKERQDRAYNLRQSQKIAGMAQIEADELFQ